MQISYEKDIKELREDNIWALSGIFNNQSKVEIQMFYLLLCIFLKYLKEKTKEILNF